jgi:hypothetical protein
MVQANRGPVRLNHGCWGLTMTPLNSTPPDTQFVMSVPKRLLRLAVWRNQARRVARESWRASNVPNLLNSRLSTASVHGYSVMLRLTQKPAQQLVRLGLPAATDNAVPIVGARRVKALLRLDCDALLALLEKRLSV